MRAALAVSLTVLAALAGRGGGGDDPREALSKTAGNLGKIRSGVMGVDVAAKGRGAGKEANLGFRLDGPFALARAGGLPVAKVRYTQISGARQASATFISTGEQAYVEVGGRTRRLDPKQTRQLRSAAGGVRRDGGLRRLRLDRWMRSPRLTDGPEVGGDATDRVKANVDVAKALTDLGGRCARAPRTWRTP